MKQKNKSGEVLLIDSPDALFELYRDVSSAGPRQYGGLRVEFATLSNQENSQWESRFSKDYLNCGCVEGATLALASVATNALWMAVARDLSRLRLTIALLSSFLGGGFGKFVGKSRAKSRLRQDILRLRDQVTDTAGWPQTVLTGQCANP